MSKLVVADIEDSSGIKKFNDTFGSENNSISVTEIEFTSLPSGISIITMSIDELSTNSTSRLSIQLGDTGGYETTGYKGTVGERGVGSANLSNGFDVSRTMVAAATYSGQVILSRVTSNKWSYSATLGRADNNALHWGAGTKTLSAELDRLKLFANGNTIDSNNGVNIKYSF